MELKLRRRQKSNMTGKVTFKLFFMANLSPKDAGAVRKYGFGKQAIYSSKKGQAAQEGFLIARGVKMFFKALISLFWSRWTRQILTVDDLVNGREISCDDIAEMLDTEDQIVEACKNLSRILDACRNFDNEFIIQVDDLAAVA